MLAYILPVYTGAVDNLLCMKNASTQRSMILYLKNSKKIKQKRKKSWRPFRIYWLISTANPALFEWNGAQLVD